MGKCDRGIDPIRSKAEYSKYQKEYPKNHKKIGKSRIMQILIKRYERSADLTARSSLSQLIATCNDEIWTTSKTWSPKKFIFKMVIIFSFIEYKLLNLEYK